MSMSPREFAATYGVVDGESRTLYLRSGIVVEGSVAGFTVRDVSGALSLEAVNIRLSEGSVVAIPWHAIDVLAAGRIETLS